MNIILIGFKGCGKTTIGKRLARRLKKEFIDVDSVIERLYHEKPQLGCREIYQKHGARFFRKLETEALKQVLKLNNAVVATGGGIVLAEKNRQLMKKRGVTVYLKMDKAQLYNQIIKNGIPAFFNKRNPKESFENLFKEREPLYAKMADIGVDISCLSIRKAVGKILQDSRLKDV